MDPSDSLHKDDFCVLKNQLIQPEPGLDQIMKLAVSMVAEVSINIDLESLLNPKFFLFKVIGPDETDKTLFHLKWLAADPVRPGAFRDTEVYCKEPQDSLVALKDLVQTGETPYDYKSAPDVIEEVLKNQEKQGTGPTPTERLFVFQSFISDENAPSQVNEEDTDAAKVLDPVLARRPSNNSIHSIFTGEKRKFRYGSDDFDENSVDSSAKEAKVLPVSKKLKQEDTQDSTDDEMSSSKKHPVSTNQLQKPDEDMDTETLLSNFPCYSEKVSPSVGPEHQALVPSLDDQPVIKDKALAKADMEEQTIKPSAAPPAVFLNDSSSVLHQEKRVPVSSELDPSDWSQSERIAFEKGLYKHATNFFEISKHVAEITRPGREPVKTPKMCIRYFYDVFYSTRPYRVWRKHEMERLEKLERQRRDEERQRQKAERRSKKRALEELSNCNSASSNEQIQPQATPYSESTLQRQLKVEEITETAQEPEDNQPTAVNISNLPPQAPEPPSNPAVAMNPLNAALLSQMQSNTNAAGSMLPTDFGKAQVPGVNPTNNAAASNILKLLQGQTMGGMAQQSANAQSQLHAMLNQIKNAQNSGGSNQSQLQIIQQLQQQQAQLAQKKNQTTASIPQTNSQFSAQQPNANASVQRALQQLTSNMGASLQAGQNSGSAALANHANLANLLNKFQQDPASQGGVNAQGTGFPNMNNLGNIVQQPMIQKLANLQQLQIMQMQLKRRQQLEQNIHTFLALQQSGQLNQSVTYEQYLLCVQQDQVSQLRNVHLFNTLINDARQGQPGVRDTATPSSHTNSPNTSPKSAQLPQLFQGSPGVAQNQSQPQGQSQPSGRNKEFEDKQKEIDRLVNKVEEQYQSEKAKLNMLSHQEKVKLQLLHQNQSEGVSPEEEQNLRHRQESDRFLLTQEQSHRMLALESERKKSLVMLKAQQTRLDTSASKGGANGRSPVTHPHGLTQHQQQLRNQTSAAIQNAAASVNGNNANANAGGITLAQLQHLTSSAQGMNGAQNQQMQQVLNPNKERQQQHELTQRILNTSTKSMLNSGISQLGLNNGASVNRSQMLSNIQAMQQQQQQQDPNARANFQSNASLNAVHQNQNPFQALQKLKRLSAETSNAQNMGQTDRMQQARARQQQQQQQQQQQVNQLNIGGMQNAGNNMLRSQQQMDTLNILNKLMSNQQNTTGPYPHLQQLQQQQRATLPNQNRALSPAAPQLAGSNNQEIQAKVSQLLNLHNLMQQQQQQQTSFPQNAQATLNQGQLQQKLGLMAQQQALRQQQVQAQAQQVQAPNVVNLQRNSSSSQGDDQPHQMMDNAMQNMKKSGGQSKSNVTCQEPGCNKSYTQRHNLLNHMRRKHNADNK